MPRSDLKRNDVPVCLEHQGTGCRIRFAKCRVAVDQSASVEAMPCAQHGDRCHLDRSTCRARGYDCGCRLLDLDQLWAIRVISKSAHSRFSEVEAPINYVEIERQVIVERKQDQRAYDRIHSAPGIPNDQHPTRLVEPNSAAVKGAVDELIKETEKLIEEARARHPDPSAAELLVEIQEMNPAAMIAIEATGRDPIDIISEAGSRQPIHELARRYFLAHPERHPETKPDPVKVLAHIRRESIGVSMAIDWEAERLGVEPVELVGSDDWDQLATLTRWRRRDRTKDEAEPAKVVPLRPRPSPIKPRPGRNQARTIFT
jgi:hypothetical protein